MLIEFQLTKDDLREATAAISKSNRKRTPRQRLVGIAFWIFLFVIMDFFIQHVAHGSDAQTAWMHIFIPLGAIMIFAGIVGLIAVVRGHERIPVRRIISITLSFFSLALISYLLGRHWTATGLSWSVLLPHTTWLLLLAGIGVAMVRGQGRALNRNWEGQPALQRLHTVDISVDGVVLTDSESRIEYRWTAFMRWEETRHLFLLLVGRNAFHMLPKRAFHGDEELSAFRAMARAIAGNKTIGFPVESVDPLVT